MPKAANAAQGRAAEQLWGAIAGPLFASAFTAIGAARAGYDWGLTEPSQLAQQAVTTGKKRVHR